MTEEADGFRSSAFFIFSAPCGAKNGGFRRGKGRMKSENKASEKAKRVKTAVWFTLGLAMLIYYFCEALFAGFRISLLWIWALGGGICLLFGALTRKFGRLPLPKWLLLHCINSSGTNMVLTRAENPTIRPLNDCDKPLPLMVNCSGIMPAMPSLILGIP